MAWIWLSLRFGLFNKFGEINSAKGQSNTGKQNIAIAQLKGLKPEGKFEFLIFSPYIKFLEKEYSKCSICLVVKFPR
ncbi:hypothetical protein SC1083_0129 [Aggregatibacter actinomycetemcomitans serotype e str. SC1083]|uniref:Uncharacterized protein n=1 Tax=Aggregatibacter actinomycetemcomitans serotype e str. SC1083 TaxID=907488 RepID=G4A5P4_AGGAC|nr:hypothetical protein SC1083_0129 [Aggregatibacter actinomycetemcomitans serotype e str. SC1083]